MSRYRIPMWGGPADGATVELDRLQDRYHVPLALDLTAIRPDTRMDTLRLSWAIYELHKLPKDELVFQFHREEP